jgi:hypothetical protein
MHPDLVVAMIMLERERERKAAMYGPPRRSRAASKPRRARRRRAERIRKAGTES